MEKAKAEVSHRVTVPREGIIPNPKKKLLDQVREVVRLKHYAIRTEQTYVDWIKRYIFFHGKRHPREMGAAEIESFLTDLAVRRRVAASTQNQALNALVFLYREVLHQEAGEFSAVRAKQPHRLPSVLAKGEVQRLFCAMKAGTHRLMARLLYGTGMRLMECVRLRVKDVMLEQNQIIVRDGKGAKDRVTILPASVKAELEEHLRRVRLLHWLIFSTIAAPVAMQRALAQGSSVAAALLGGAFSAARTAAGSGATTLARTGTGASGLKEAIAAAAISTAAAGESLAETSLNDGGGGGSVIRSLAAMQSRAGALYSKPASFPKNDPLGNRTVAESISKNRNPYAQS